MVDCHETSSNVLEFTDGFFMPAGKTKSLKARALRDLAVRAVMARGALEPRQGSKLAILREKNLMIGYRTPFNPLPEPSEELKYRSAVAGRDTVRAAYGIDIWIEEAGKVFSVRWTLADELTIELVKPGAWQDTVAALSAQGMSGPRSASMARAADRAMRSLERENRQLRQTVANLSLDRLILSKATASEL
jgi:hypothetical protein